MKDFLNLAQSSLNYHLFKLAGADLTISSVLGALIALVVLLIAARWIRTWLLARLLARGHLDLGTRETISSLLNYIVLAIGIVMIMDGVGIKLSSFTVIAGALGVGVGFGLQNIFSNFISGLIVMFERPVKIGDHIVVSGIEGDVVQIGMRATWLLTSQNSLAIVPNQSLITGSVINWSASGVSAASLQFKMNGKIIDDEALLLRCVADQPDVVKSPAPTVFVSTIDHAFHLLEIHFRLSGNAEARQQAISGIYRAVDTALTEKEQTLAA